MENILIISHKWQFNRDTKSSIESFCAKLSKDFHVFNGRRIKFSYRIGKMLIYFSNSVASMKYSAPYNSHFAGEELYGLFRIIRLKPAIVFFPYGDYNYNYSWLFKKILGFKIVIYTFFSEEELSLRFKSLKHFQRADLILVAGEGQLHYLQSRIDSLKLQYFPLPIDTNFFSPGTDYIPFRLLQVGNNRRDFKTLFAALEILIKKYPLMRLDMIGCKILVNDYRHLDYVIFHDFLEDEKMLQIYQKSHLQLLILEDGGSSNSLNEGLACGLPIVVTRLANISDYVDDDTVSFVERYDVLGIVKATSRIIEDSVFRLTLSKKSRNKSLEFSEDNAVLKFNQLIKSI